MVDRTLELSREVTYRGWDIKFELGRNNGGQLYLRIETRPEGQSRWFAVLETCPGEVRGATEAIVGKEPAASREVTIRGWDVKAEIGKDQDNNIYIAIYAKRPEDVDWNLVIEHIPEVSRG